MGQSAREIATVSQSHSCPANWNKVASIFCRLPICSVARVFVCVCVCREGVGGLRPFCLMIASADLCYFLTPLRHPSGYKVTHKACPYVLIYSRSSCFLNTKTKRSKVLPWKPQRYIYRRFLCPHAHSFAGFRLRLRGFPQAFSCAWFHFFSLPLAQD